MNDKAPPYIQKLWDEGKINVGQMLALERVDDLLELEVTPITLEMIKWMVEEKERMKQ